MRPTLYSDEILRKTEGYLVDYGVLPSVAGLSRRLGVARSTVYLWAEQHQEFSDILGDVLAEQEKSLIEKGLVGDFNSTITKLILTKHGYSDKVDQTVEGNVQITEVRKTVVDPRKDS